jgi:hypothetical protein
MRRLLVAALVGALSALGGCVRGPTPLPVSADASDSDADATTDAGTDTTPADAAPPDATLPPPLDFGVTFSPVGLGTQSAGANAPAFYAARASHGRIVAYHIGWRDNENGIRPSCGTPPGFASNIEAAVATYGFTLSLVVGWSTGAGEPDLACAPELTNDWSNPTTRARYKDVVVGLVTKLAPAYLFLGNEVNTWFLAHPTDWANWLSELDDVAKAARAASPSTKVGTVYQYDHLRGGGAKNGWTDAPQWQLVADVVGKVDVLGITTYPYFDYDTPSTVPDDHYAELRSRWAGELAITETAWRASPSAPYAGSVADQAAWPTRMHQLFGPRLRYATWLLLNDADPSVDLGPFAATGLRDSAGVPRQADAAWRALVATHQAP